MIINGLEYTEEQINSIRQWKKMTPVIPVALLPKMVITPLGLMPNRLDGWISPWTGEPLGGRTHGKSHITAPPFFTFRLKPAQSDPVCEEWWRWRRAGVQFPRSTAWYQNHGVMAAYRYIRGVGWSGRLTPEMVDIGGFKVNRHNANKIDHLVNTGPK